MQKVKSLLENLQDNQQTIVHSSRDVLPDEVTAIPPKISKGENYKGLPWLVLDYPRRFERNNHFAIRSMFWWGNFFSSTLHLSGVYQKKYAPVIKHSFPRLQAGNYHICIGKDEWEHHFDETNYQALQKMDAATFGHYTDHKDFLKLAVRSPLSNWDEAGDWLLKAFGDTLKMLVGEKPVR